MSLCPFLGGWSGDTCGLEGVVRSKGRLALAGSLLQAMSAQWSAVLFLLAPLKMGLKKTRGLDQDFWGDHSGL